MIVTIDGKEVLIAFITNNTGWAASTVGELYQARWGIEVFFKQLTQTLQVCDFPGHSKHAIRWQLRAALLLYVLMRYLGQTVDLAHSDKRPQPRRRAPKFEKAKSPNRPENNAPSTSAARPLAAMGWR